MCWCKNCGYKWYSMSVVNVKCPRCASKEEEED